MCECKCTCNETKKEYEFKAGEVVKTNTGLEVQIVALHKDRAWITRIGTNEHAYTAFKYELIPPVTTKIVFVNIYRDERASVHPSAANAKAAANSNCKNIAIPVEINI